MHLRSLSRLAIVLCMFAMGAAHAAMKADLAKSSVTATFRQLGVPVEGKFKSFTAQIEFEAAKPQAAKAAIEIDIASFDLGDPDFNKEVVKKEWFNAAQFPKASFTSTGIKPAGAGKYDVAGKLTIKGKTADVAFPMTVKQEGKAQIFEGALPIKRLTYNIGEGDWKDTSLVADEVVIKFRVVAAH